jgi:ABC-2 type transport system ATP-binding protein
MTDDPAIEATGLMKCYNGRPVVDGIDLTVAGGTVFALLGPNGAGKTTAVRILATLTAPDGGRARVAGCDVVRERHAVRRRISLTGQYAAVDGLQTGAENLRMIGRLQGLSARAARDRATELLEVFDLTDAGARRAATYSGGMRRRLDLAASLMRRPGVLFLDEPTTGLDPRSRRELWRLVRSLVADGVTVFLTTQYLDEADALADRIAVLDRGRLVAEGSAPELKAAVATRRLVVECDGPAAFHAVLRRAGERALESDLHLRTVALGCDGGSGAVRTLLDELDPGRNLIADFAVQTASLDDVFMTLTGHAADGATASTPKSVRSDD